MSKRGDSSGLRRFQHVQRIVVFQQGGSGELKVAGIKSFGRGMEITRVFDLPDALPDVIDEPEEYLREGFDCDLVLNFLRHPDLSEYLVRLCNLKGIPVIASGRRVPGAITPFTCCGLGKIPSLGAYAVQFGIPEYEVELSGGRIASVKVLRGASCGATWRVAEELVGMDVEEAKSAAGRLVQYICAADPSGFDPVSGKSPLHFAGDVHILALKNAIEAKARAR